MTRSFLTRLSFVFARVRPLLESRKLPLFAALLAALLTSPSIFSGLATEDWIQRDLIRTKVFPFPSQVNLFGHEHPWSAAEVIARDWEYQLYGWFPWVADRHFDASFWRPLASLTHQLDYRVWPEQPWLMHVESVLWYAALAAAVAVLHRRLVQPRWVAGLASLLYAADDAHGHPVGWIINRNGVMATLFSVLALWAYDRFRRDTWRPGAWLTPVFFGLGLLSAEFALCAAGYFVAYVVFVDRGPVRQRLLGASTWLGTLAAWTLYYRHLGHTTHGSGLYIDPVTDPVSFLFELFERGTVLLMGQLAAPFSNTWTRTDLYTQGFLVFWAAMLVWLVSFLLWPLLVRDRMARFWAAGVVLSLPPACATFPEDRLLLLAGLGAFPLIALFIGAVTHEGLPPSARRVPSVALTAAWLAIHAVAAPLLLPYRSLHMYHYDREIQEAGRSAFANIRSGPGQSLIVVNGQNFYFAGMMHITRVSRGLPTVTRMLTLAGTLEDVTISRLDTKRLAVHPRFGFFSRVFNRIYRNRALRFVRGSKIDLRGVDVTIGEVNQWGEPTTAIFDFSLPLESDHYQWIAWKNGRYEAFVPPPVGNTVVVHGS